MMMTFQASQECNHTDFRWEIFQKLYISQGNISAIPKDFYREKINAVNYFPIILMYFMGKTIHG